VLQINVTLQYLLLLLLHPVSNRLFFTLFLRK